MTTFATLLIANRGEIACRIIRTARAMGLRTIAVFSDADAQAMHVALADTAIRLGPAPARESYLSIPALIAAARATGAEAIHPGYGFLSENADFAAACAQAGLVFVGPPPAAIRAMGSKAAAKALMDKAGVPLVPGYHGADQADATLRAEAHRIGFPILVKASAGGGGKGMKVATDAAALDEALTLARGEARAAFGDDRLLLERYLTKPRHIEIQVFADSHGNVVHLHERDCSIQRRHQKVVEEAPAPGMTAERRAAMGKAACDAARAIGYVGAGTVEFISEGDSFAFMEMNTRLQVEHPVTEAITGQDLVEWQLRVAMGEPLPLSQAKIPLAGHAIEVRLYAEDPARDFAPSIGVLRHLALPDHLPGIRIDSGVRQGDAVPIHYDPMLAKIIASGPDRATALRRLSRGLDAAAVAGIRSNLPLLRAIAAHPAFARADLDTGFIARHAAQLLPEAVPAPRAALASAALRLLRDAGARDASDPHSPWGAANAWRLNGDGYQDLLLFDGDSTVTLRLHPGRGIDFADGGAALDHPRWDGDALSFSLDGRAIRATVARDGDLLMVVLDGATHELRFLDPRAPSGEEQAGGGRILAPMPGRILQLLAAPGDRVLRGAVLLVMEAMKVQMRITAPIPGTVQALRCQVGDLVEDGAELVVVEPDPPA
ncbi:acetyl/propionyl/methylcrotonyl-CoA carboxylase subunit alpha [Falsiroseomonas stagni]|uniref:3-methylcrotonyl-CoA carboxylase alpha subunit n=1 Tax=Falsiroseomonas stagni DSM 19981 TaxID=1123062 RepID=A0A1I4E602_9PROT|nr:biotin carboxylase N-terminal domain-containing protein [Falsiroseomonas stagni]SFL00589.1 3-methylcrotonyl-CoA carboxylase alpha subunit [Falsiroseomonas stagni DSM 19981]